ncbi:SDR family oxidoreductase [Telmatospirillum siberiense]|uniref:SDR family oxidoreductase n=1 Tax=Telmatospirillum siberiense TaxID=382514 RepID=UPI0018EADDAE|nr:SDR family NAD(P)-dependent oxidoreductase [Telmatospirillum siberiense]
MKSLSSKVAWVVGAGSGIGEACAMTLAEAGATVVLTGRRRPLLEETAERITKSGGKAVVEDGDLGLPGKAEAIAKAISGLGRLDVMVNAAGVNVAGRRWSDLSAESIGQIVGGNLSAALLVSRSALGLMRPRKDGLLIHIGSWAAHFLGTLAGPVYTATKCGVVAMSHTINMEDGRNGIRSCVLSPGEVATPLLDQRPSPIGTEERAAMLQPADVADLVLYLAGLPPRVCVNEIIVSPTANRMY